MRVLDLFSGRGGFSKAWKNNGHEVVTLDNNRDGKFQSTHSIDIYDFQPLDHYAVGHFDVILGGVPCTEYARWGMRGVNRSLQNKSEEELRPNNNLLKEFIRIRDALQPKFWIVENVQASVSFISHFLGKPFRIGRRWFWSNMLGFKDFYGETEMKLIHLSYIPKTFRYKYFNKRLNKYTWVGRGRRGPAHVLSNIEYPISEALMYFILNDIKGWKKRSYERIREIRKSRDDYNKNKYITE